MEILLTFFSYLDQSSNYDAARLYEVVRVVHGIRDVDDSIPASKEGFHEVQIFVKPLSDQDLA